MARDAALLGIPVDTVRLFDGADDYGLWIASVIEEVADVRRAAGS